MSKHNKETSCTPSVQKVNYTIDNPTITNEDCLELLKQIHDNSVDLVLTDLPYFISKKTGFLKGDLTNDDNIWRLTNR